MSKQVLCIRIEKENLDKLRGLSKMSGHSIAGYIRWILNRHLKGVEIVYHQNPEGSIGVEPVEDPVGQETKEAEAG